MARIGEGVDHCLSQKHFVVRNFFLLVNNTAFLKIRQHLFAAMFLIERRVAYPPIKRRPGIEPESHGGLSVSLRLPIQP